MCGTYYSVDMSAPAKAKSQSCFLQFRGEVRPGWRPHLVRYSIQFGPPSAVAVWWGVGESCIWVSLNGIFEEIVRTWFWTIVFERRVCASYA